MIDSRRRGPGPLPNGATNVATRPRAARPSSRRRPDGASPEEHTGTPPARPQVHDRCTKRTDSHPSRRAPRSGGAARGAPECRRAIRPAAPSRVGVPPRRRPPRRGRAIARRGRAARRAPPPPGAAARRGRAAHLVRHRRGAKKPTHTTTRSRGTAAMPHSSAPRIARAPARRPPARWSHDLCTCCDDPGLTAPSACAGPPPRRRSTRAPSGGPVGVRASPPWDGRCTSPPRSSPRWRRAQPAGVHSMVLVRGVRSRSSTGTAEHGVRPRGRRGGRRVRERRVRHLFLARVGASCANATASRPRRATTAASRSCAGAAPRSRCSARRAWPVARTGRAPRPGPRTRPSYDSPARRAAAGRSAWTPATAEAPAAPPTAPAPAAPPGSAVPRRGWRAGTSKVVATSEPCGLYRSWRPRAGTSRRRRSRRGRGRRASTPRAGGARRGVLSSPSAVARSRRSAAASRAAPAAVKVIAWRSIAIASASRRRTRRLRRSRSGDRGRAADAPCSARAARARPTPPRGRRGAPSGSWAFRARRGGGRELLRRGRGKFCRRSRRRPAVFSPRAPRVRRSALPPRARGAPGAAASPGTADRSTSSQKPRLAQSTRIRPVATST